MKLLISNQHGAIVMALMPFLYGMLLSHPIWQHIFFLLAWFSLYLMTYPFLNLFKGRNLELYIKWSWIYFFACVIFAIADLGSYYFPDRTFDDKIWLVALYPSLFFIGTTLYVKSVMRERKNPLYLKLSIGFHALCILGFILVEQYLMALAFVPPFIRAIWLPKKKMSVKQVGFTEMGISLLFFANLLYATL